MSELIKPGSFSIDDDPRSIDQSLISSQTGDAAYYFNNSPRLQKGEIGKQLLQGVLGKDYTYEAILKNKHLIAYVVKVLEDEESIVAAASLLTSASPRIPDLTKRKIVFAHVLGFEGHSLPPNPDHPLATMTGKYYSFEEDSSDKYNNVKVGSYVWVKLFGDNPADQVDGFSGQLLGLFRREDTLANMVLEDRVKPKFDPECKANLMPILDTKELVRGDTYKNPQVGQPIIRKFKTKIKTGIYGNGSVQTKAHFNESLRIHKKSYGYETSPPLDIDFSLSSRNSFIWVGHLRSNGYLDILDRPADLGRETIIYAPMTLNVFAPIELKYYFHDAGGFGTAWINGPTSTTDSAIANAADTGNDFTEKIAPGIADMIRDKRNFILVIPEMAFSRGFGTSTDAVDKYKILTGESTAGWTPGQRPLSDTTAFPTLRTSIESTVVMPTVMKYLGSVLKPHVDDPQTILQKTHLRERETVTFDGSYSGGNFGDFNADVLSVITQYLGRTASDNINYTSIVADGLGAISMASIVKTYPTYAPAAAAQSGFKGLSINRIDYIENGQNVEGSFNFSESPLLTFYKEYISTRPPVPRLEFNYIALANPPNLPGKRMFDEIGYSAEFQSNIKKPASGDQDPIFIAEPLGTGGPLINVHTVSEAKKGAGYSFYLRTNTDSMLVPQQMTPNSTLINLPSQDSVPNHAKIISERLSDGVLEEYAKKKKDLESNLQAYEANINNMADSRNPLRETDKYNSLTNNYLDERIEYHKYEELIRQEIQIKRYKRNRARMQLILNDPTNGIKNQIEEKNKFLNSEDEFKKVFPEANVSGIIDTVSFLGTDDQRQFFNVFSYVMDKGDEEKIYTFNKAFTRLKRPDKPIPTAEQQSGDFKVFVGQRSADNYSIGKPGIFDIICREIGLKEALITLKGTIEKTLESLEPLGNAEIDEKCEPPPLTLGFLRRNESPIVFNRAGRRINEISCEGKTIRVVSNYRDLKEMIEWDPNITALKAAVAGKKSAELDSGAGSSIQVKHFKYKSRGPNNSIKFRNSPNVWTCISKKLEDAWEAACNISGYIPFRIFNGIKGYKKDNEMSPGTNIYHNGMEVGNWGLTLTIDNPIAGYKGNGDPVYSVFTNTWSGKFLEAHQDELYELGILSDLTFSSLDGTFGISGRYMDNAYEGFFAREKRRAQNWKEATDSAFNSKTEQSYNNIMKSARNSQIVPDNADPLLWVLTFCERSGMKWGNSFFMRKRHRGPREGIQWLGIANRAETPISWSLAEQKRISAIYGIEDVVARVNAISFPQTTYDAHMHFQYYSGSPIITWEEIKSQQE